MPDHTSLENYFRLLQNIKFKLKESDNDELIKLSSQSGVEIDDNPV
jgi:hypothetical protein